MEAPGERGGVEVTLDSKQGDTSGMLSFDALHRAPTSLSPCRLLEMRIRHLMASVGGERTTQPATRMH